MDITNPARFLATTVAQAHPVHPGLVEATFEFVIPNTSAPELVLQALKVAGADSASSNTLPVQLVPPLPCEDPGVQFVGGDGSAGNPFQICSQTGLVALGGRANTHAIQVGDIDMDPWVGGIDLGLGSTFDGNGYTIRNYFHRDPLFDRVINGTLRNIVMRDAIAVNAEFGLMGGWFTNTSVSNVDIEGLVLLGHNRVGAVVGSAEGCMLDGVRVRVDVTGGSDVGGVVGFMDGGTLLNADVTATVAGDENVGGVVGFVADSGSVQIRDVDAVVSVTGGQQAAVGGVVGFGGSCSLIDVLADVDVLHGRDVGGLVGYGDRLNITRGGAWGHVRGSGLHTGGLVGRTSNSTTTVTDSFGRVGVTAFTGSSSCSTGGIMGLVGVGVLERVVSAPPFVDAPTTSYDLVGGQCLGTTSHNVFRNVYVVETVPGSELATDPVDVSAAPGDEASYPNLTFSETGWTMPLSHPAGDVMPVASAHCGRMGIICASP